jgi:hypothetical protein
LERFARLGEKSHQQAGAFGADRSGSAVINDRAYWISGWKGVSKSGTPYLRLSFKPKESAGNSKPKAKPDINDTVDF